MPEVERPDGTEDVTLRVPAGGGDIMVHVHPAAKPNQGEFLALAAALHAAVRTQGESQGGAQHIYTLTYKLGNVETTVFGPRVDGNDDIPF